MIYEPTMLDIWQSKQVFVDDLVIESVENVCRTWHQPTRVETPVIVRDRPWNRLRTSRSTAPGRVWTCPR